MPRLILGSGSVHRRRLLSRLRLEFDVISPDADESARPGEHPREIAIRLAAAKVDRICRAVDVADAVVIGADQTAALDGRRLRKPGDRDTAIRQLLECRGRTVFFHTACEVLDGPTGQRFRGIDSTQVRFLQLEPARIERYVDIERPYDCTGGFQAEGLGIALFESIDSTDPTALPGLPLVWLCAVLRQVGLDPLAPVEPAPPAQASPGSPRAPGAAARGS